MYDATVLKFNEYYMYVHTCANTLYQAFFHHLVERLEPTWPQPSPPNPLTTGYAHPTPSPQAVSTQPPHHRLCPSNPLTTGYAHPNPSPQAVSIQPPHHSLCPAVSSPQQLWETGRDGCSTFWGPSWCWAETQHGIHADWASQSYGSVSTGSTSWGGNNTIWKTGLVHVQYTVYNYTNYVPLLYM